MHVQYVQYRTYKMVTSMAYQNSLYKVEWHLRLCINPFYSSTVQTDQPQAVDHIPIINLYPANSNTSQVHVGASIGL